ncbi:MAG: hypothetical protein QW655_03530 [Nitrososphaerota archaeon]|nr:hypothetical protein [Candidatus Geocrenenecus dongiae]
MNLLSTWIINCGEYMRLVIGFPFILLYLGIFFFTISVILYGIYAITNDWR